MADLLKDYLNHAAVRDFALTIKSVYNAFDVDGFLASTLDETWDNLELKARGRKISTHMGEFLPQDFAAAIAVCDKVVPTCDGWFCMIFPNFIEVYGGDAKNWDISIKALEMYTQYGSSEFAVRPFIIKDEARMMAQMYAWTKHENEHVRRLASEGCRPALPWAMALNSFKKDPASVLPILEALKADSSAYVRKSVANNLNDISKTHPDLVARLAKDWHGKNADTDWVVKHGCRTLLKKGNPDVLAIFGFDDADAVDVSGLTLDAPEIAIGGDITFSFKIAAAKDMKVRLEYGIDFMKANGKQSRKIFQISEMAMAKGQEKLYSKAHSFADLSTRKHYPGAHSVTLIVNGKERGTLDFNII